MVGTVGTALFDGGETPWWVPLLEYLLPFVTPQLVVTLIIGILALVLVLVLGGFLFYRRARRSPRLGRLLLSVQEEYMPPGPERELVRLRLRAREAVAGAQQAVAALEAGDGPRGDLAALLRRVERAGDSLDAQLRVMAGEPDSRALAAVLPTAAERVDDVVAVARRVRRTAEAALAGAMDVELRELTADAEREAKALQAGVDALEALSLEAGVAGRTRRADGPASRR